MAQDAFSVAHTLTIFEPIWPKLQNLSKTLMGSHFLNCPGNPKTGYYMHSTIHKHDKKATTAPMNEILIIILLQQTN